MVAPVLEMKLEVECLKGTWYLEIAIYKGYFKGNVRFTLESLTNPIEPRKYFETFVKWRQPTPLHYY